jgi:phosphoserine phosphatase
MELRSLSVLAAAVGLLFNTVAGAAGSDPLPGWQDGRTKQTLLEFIAQTTRSGSPRFVPVAERIAVFDNDGTLWSEQPVYVQFAFALDRIKALAPRHPEWQSKEPFKSVLAGDLKGALGGGEQSIVEMLMATHAGMTSEEFEDIARQWLASARNPKTGRLYREMTYEPMVELLRYLRTRGYKTYIVSGGGSEFLRVFAQDAYGIPPEQVIGSSITNEYQVRDGKPVLVREPKVHFVDDGPGKPVGINEYIGRRPVLAFGNSDGDFQMLEWTTAGAGARLGLLLHHDDAAREVAYDRDSPVGKLANGLDEGPARGWLIVSMKDDWKRVFAPGTVERQRD